MLFEKRLVVRLASPNDRNAITALTRGEERVHVHLDWKPVEDWLGDQPFLIAERGRRTLGAMACPPDPPDTAWLRLFTQTDDIGLEQLWDTLWEQAQGMLVERGVRVMAVLSVEEWLGQLCVRAGFTETHGVIVLSRPRGSLPARPAIQSQVVIRPAVAADRPAIIAADLAAFDSPWQMSPPLVELALARGDLLTVAQAAGAIVGYQLTTPTHQGAHLARLAVLPEHQGRGVGAALVAHLIEYYNRRGARELTVNTQDTNQVSLRLYQRLGFSLTNMRFPVYQLDLAKAPGK